MIASNDAAKAGGSARTRLSQDAASRLVTIALGHVGKEFPYIQTGVLFGPEDLKRLPMDDHPIFHGSYDWHSCVHSYWLLARLNRLYPDMPQGPAIVRRIDSMFTPEKFAGELAFFERKYSEDFERPYGWTWFLKLVAELNHYETEAGRRWAASAKPMAEYLAKRFGQYITVLPRPIRDGAHPNTAFNMAIALDYIDNVGDEPLKKVMHDRALEWFLRDAAPVRSDYGPTDFLSPIMTEAELMRRVLPADAFSGWLERYLPNLTEAEPAILFELAEVTDPTDGALAHLDGVNLCRAWAMRNIARALGEDPRAAVLSGAADAHLAAGIGKVAGDYMSEHWLATYGLLALEAAEGQ